MIEWPESLLYWLISKMIMQKNQKIKINYFCRALIFVIEKELSDSVPPSLGDAWLNCNSVYILMLERRISVSPPSL